MRQANDMVTLLCGLATLPQLQANDPMTTRGRAALSGYADLRDQPLPKGDIEVRMWSGFMMFLPQCMIFRFHKGQWSAVKLPSSVSEAPKSELTKSVGAPVHGWSHFWRRANELGLWWLPSESLLPVKDYHGVLDGIAYVVEIRRFGTYRSYSYANPEFQTQWPEAMRVVDLYDLLGREFPEPKSK